MSHVTTRQVLGFEHVTVSLIIGGEGVMISDPELKESISRCLVVGAPDLWSSSPGLPSPFCHTWSTKHGWLTPRCHMVPIALTNGNFARALIQSVAIDN